LEVHVTAGSARPGSRYGGARAPINACGAALAVVLALAAPAAAEGAARIVVLGDSLASGYGVAADEAFPARLEARLAAAGIDAEVLNAGVAGDTSAGGLARLDWVLADKPDYAIVELGANDALRGVDPAATEANLAAIIETLQAAGVRVMLAGMRAPPNMGAAYADAFAAIYPRLAARTGVALYPFFLDGVAAHPELIQADGLHPTAQGLDEMARRMLPAVQAWLEGG
jgi:acyl-CoA thioesterase-1